MIDAERVADRPALAGDFDRDCRLTGFDASLVAADWAAAKGRDLTGEGAVSVADILLASGRAGPACGQAVASRPGPAGDMALKLSVSGPPSGNQPFDVDVVATGRGNVGGFELALDLPDDKVEVVGFTPTSALAGARTLGPDRVKEKLRIGAYAARGLEAGGEVLLGKLTLKLKTSEPLDLAVLAAQIVTDHGGEYVVTADGVVVSPEPWRPSGTVYLPRVARP
jgi:hypothetical protein